MKLRLAACLLALGLAGTPALLSAQESASMETKVETATPKTPVVGEVFPDFDGVTYDGKEFTLHGSLGKVTLVDFWATWCGPCIGELPYVKKAYADLHDKGFNIVAVSLDSKKEALQKFYENEETHLPWVSAFDGKGWGTELAKRFNIRSIPATFLLDEKGVVIATDLRGNNLYKQVAKRIAPDMAPPPDLEDLLDQYMDDATQRAKLGPAIIELAHGNQAQSNSFAWVHLDEGTPTRESAALCYEMLRPTLDRGKDAMTMDTIALAAFHKGDAQKALEIQQASLDIVEGSMKKEGADDAMLAKNPMLMEFKARLALYQAAAGHGDKAKATIEAIESNAGETDEIPGAKYLKMAREALATAKRS